MHSLSCSRLMLQLHCAGDMLAADHAETALQSTCSIILPRDRTQAAERQAGNCTIAMQEASRTAGSMPAQGDTRLMRTGKQPWPPSPPVTSPTWLQAQILHGPMRFCLQHAACWLLSWPQQHFQRFSAAIACSEIGLSETVVEPGSAILGLIQLWHAHLLSKCRLKLDTGSVGFETWQSLDLSAFCQPALCRCIGHMEYMEVWDECDFFTSQCTMLYSECWVTLLTRPSAQTPAKWISILFAVICHGKASQCMHLHSVFKCVSMSAIDQVKKESKVNPLLIALFLQLMTCSVLVTCVGSFIVARRF